jgi:hypothetical protein
MHYQSDFFNLHLHNQASNIAHLACSSIYWVVLCPLFAFFRWRDCDDACASCQQYCFGVALYISLGCLGVNKKMMNGFLMGERLVSYFVRLLHYCGLYLRKNWFQTVSICFVPDLLGCRHNLVPVTLQNDTNYKISMLPSEYHRFVDPIVASQ